VLFAELDNKSLNLRVALLLEKDLNRFFKISVGYERDGNSEPCVGVINAVLNCFPSHYNMWHSYNFTTAQSESHKEGQLIFIVEDSRSNTSLTPINYFHEARINVSVLNNYSINDGKIFFKDVKVSTLNTETVGAKLKEHNLKGTQYKHDVFISYGNKDTIEIDKVIQALIDLNITFVIDAKGLDPGNKFVDKILDLIKSSKEFIVICTPESLTSKWVNFEIGYAKAMGKEIIPVLYKVGKDDLPDYLRELQFVRIENFKECAKKMKVRIND